jgi:hypothetical protein
LAKLVAGLKTLSQIETVRGIHIGVPAATERRAVVDTTYDVSELLLFADVVGHEAYRDHPILKQFVAECAELWDRVVVYDAIAIRPTAASEYSENDASRASTPPARRRWVPLGD